MAARSSRSRGVVLHGTGTRAAIPGWDIFGKTGTTNRSQDAWFNGATTTIAASVWLGHREGEIPMTFIAVAAIYLGGEVYRAVAHTDNVSRMAHLLGGVSGAAFGFLSARGKRVVGGTPMTELLPAARKHPDVPNKP